jgi:hypothetical protein
MAQAHASIRIDASPDLVWQFIGGLDSLADGSSDLPPDERGTEGTSERSLYDTVGELIVKRLEYLDNSTRTYTYTILEAPLPVTAYRATVSVHAIDEGRASRVDWFAEFTPAGVSDEEATRLFERIFQRGLHELVLAFADASLI